ncbi:MAG: hypothetical protein M3209_03060 [Acidobacteriota bacterium]|nr:hypothetical protein [Acidobacteriota bacterium]
METVGIIVWIVFAIYSALCLWMPNIRPYWKGSDIRFGTLSCIGFALFVWFPFFVAVISPLIGGFDKSDAPFLFLVIVLAVVIAFIGYFVDAEDGK